MTPDCWNGCRTSSVCTCTISLARMFFFLFFQPNYTGILYYGKCPKNSNTKVSDKMTYANSVDPDQTAPEGAV